MGRDYLAHCPKLTSKQALNPSKHMKLTWLLSKYVSWQVNSCIIPEGAVVEPCSAASHPAQKGAKSQVTNSAAVRTAEKPVGAIPALLAVIIFCVVSSIMYMPAIGEWHLFERQSAAGG